MSLDTRHLDDVDQSVIDDYQGPTRVIISDKRFPDVTVAFDVDLSEENVKRLLDVVNDFRRAGTHVQTKVRKTTTTTGKPNTLSEDIRQWGRENGFTVSDRGAVPKKLQEAYAAHMQASYDPDQTYADAETYVAEVTNSE